jgi:hypothetical protein
MGCTEIWRGGQGYLTNLDAIRIAQKRKQLLINTHRCRVRKPPNKKIGRGYKTDRQTDHISFHFFKMRAIKCRRADGKGEEEPGE